MNLKKNTALIFTLALIAVGGFYFFHARDLVFICSCRKQTTVLDPHENVKQNAINYLQQSEKLGSSPIRLAVKMCSR